MAGFPSLLENAFSGWRNFTSHGAKAQAAPGSQISLVSQGKPRREREPAELARMVESEIIPRLMLAHKPSAAPPAADPPLVLGEADAESFARLVMTKESDSLVVYVGTLLQRGVSMESIYADLLAPAARRLGEYWDEDSISFADVTIGLGRLQQAIRTLGWEFPPEEGEEVETRSALFIPAAGEQHTFGLYILEDVFRRAGWRTWIEAAASPKDAVDAVRCHWFDLVGLTATRETQTEDIKETVKAMREASRNPGVLVMVGGLLFVNHPELVLTVGADATAVSGGEALHIAEKAIRRLQSAS